jgi:lysophospholipase L1-like esterase
MKAEFGNMNAIEQESEQNDQERFFSRNQSSISSYKNIFKVFAGIMFLTTAMICRAGENKLPLELPPVVYAVPGIESNIYFDNLVLTINSRNYAFEVKCSKGRNNADRWSFTPNADDIGTYDWNLKVYDSANQVVAAGSTKLTVVPADAGKDRKISMLIVGDSLTDISIYPAALRDLLQQPGNPDVTFLGTNGGRGKPAGDIAHEGYGGWQWMMFCTRWTDDKQSPYRAKSKFLTLKDGKPVLDFKAYLDKYADGKIPDFITVMLGPNDVFRASDDSIEEVYIKRIFFYADMLIAEFRKVAPNARIGLGLTVPPASSQDAFGANYNCRQTRWQYRRNQFRLVERMIEKFGNDKVTNVSLIPVFVGLDCENNYPVSSEKINSRNSKTIMRQSNGLHPAPEGYYQIADAFYCWIKFQLASQK